MRVRLQDGTSESLLSSLLPLTGSVLHPSSNRAEWAIVALDHPVQINGLVIDLLWLRPAAGGTRIGDAAVPAPVAAAMGVSVTTEESPVYKVGELLGQLLCVPET